MRRCGTTIVNWGTKPFRVSIVPGGGYGGDGAIFAAENPIFQSKNRFSAVSAPENPQDFSGNWRGAHEGRRLWRKQAVVSPMSKGGPLVRFAHIGGPKGWSGEHTKRSAVRSHGTPRKRQRRAVRRCGTTIAN